MLKQLKKYISILLALCMCFHITGVFAYAAPEIGEINVLYDTSGLNEADFSTKRLLILTEEETDIVDSRYIIGQYDTLYLLQYDTVEQVMNAYSYYVDHNVIVEPDIVISVADNSEMGDAEIKMSTDSNPVQNAAILKSSGTPFSIELPSNRTIALIDTGVDEEKAIDRVSVLDRELSVGTHGNEMADAVFTQNKSARIVSIRALDENGNGTVSSVVAAIQYAIDNKLDIINLSLEAKRSLSSAVLEKAIKNAVDAGIYVVGSAGNDNDDVKNYIPGSIKEAYIVGSANEDGTKADFSNFGETVDYNVVSTSTSEAAALFSGYISRNDVEDIELNDGLIYETKYVAEDTSDAVISGLEGDLEDTGHRIRTKATFIDGTKDIDGLTIDEVMDTEEYLMGMYLFQKEYYTTVFDNGDKNYYVAYLDTPYERGVSSAHAIDVAFARDNYHGEVIDGCKYDYETGVAYIPREYIDTFKAAEDETFTLQSQILCPYISDELGMKEVKVPVTVENKLTGESVDTTALAQVMEDTFTVSLVDAGSADDVDVSSIEVFLNNNAIRYTAVSADDYDAETMSLAETAVYDDTTGDLLIPVSVAGVQNLHVAFNGVDASVSAQTIYGNSTILSGLNVCNAILSNIDITVLAGQINQYFCVTGYSDASGDYLVKRNTNSWGPGYAATSNGSDANWHSITNESSSYTLTPIVNQGNLDTHLREKDLNTLYTPGLAVRWDKGSGMSSTLMNLNWNFQSSVATRLYKANCTHISAPYYNDQGETPIYAKIIGVDTEKGIASISFTSFAKPGADGQTCSMALNFKVPPQKPNNPDLTISKTDYTTATPLTGAEFKLYYWDDANKNYYSRDLPIYTSVDNGDGTYTFKDIDISKYGTNYLIRETKAPRGYTLSYGMHDANDILDWNQYGGRQVDWNKSTNTWTAHSGREIVAWNWFQDLPHELIIEKQDYDTHERLTGAVFQLFSWSDGYKDPIATAVDNGDGTYTFPRVSFKTYGYNFLVREISPPEGYATPYVPICDADQTNLNDFGGREYIFSSERGGWVPNRSGYPAWFGVFFNKKSPHVNLTIHKVIQSEDIWWAHGQPTFLFNVTGTDIDGNTHTYNRMVTFTEEYVNSNTDSDGNIAISATITNIPSGQYIITENKVSRFGLVDVTAQTSNITVTKHETGNEYDGIRTITATVTADLRETDGEVTFFNRKITWDQYNHPDPKINTFTIEK